MGIENIDPASFAGMTEADRLALTQLSAAIREQNALARGMVAAAKQPEKGWFRKAMDAIESHPVATLSVVLLAAVAAEAYIYSRRGE